MGRSACCLTRDSVQAPRTHIHSSAVLHVYSLRAGGTTETRRAGAGDPWPASQQRVSSRSRERLISKKSVGHERRTPGTGFWPPHLSPMILPAGALTFKCDRGGNHTLNQKPLAHESMFSQHESRANSVIHSPTMDALVSWYFLPGNAGEGC